MKILQVCMSQGLGGLELYILKVVKFLEKQQYSYNVITENKSFLHKKLLTDDFINNAFNPIFHHFPLISAFKLAQHIDANKIDVIHAHWGKDLLFVVLAKIFSRRKVKLVFTRHMALTRKKDDFYHRFLYRNIDAYLVITKKLYNDALKYLPIDKNRIHLIYHGVADSAISKNESDCEKYIKEIHMDGAGFRLVIFGRIEEGKGQHFVINAVKKLKEKGHNIQLAMVGHIMDKEYYKFLEDEITKYKLADNIFYLGFHNNPLRIMPCFDAVVLATKCETFGLVLPEAMRAGVTVIGSDCGGVPEIIEHEKTGLLFESENINDLTQQLLKIVNDKDFCIKLSHAGKLEADERFSEEKHFNRLIKIFESA